MLLGAMGVKMSDAKVFHRWGKSLTTSPSKMVANFLAKTRCCCGVAGVRSDKDPFGNDDDDDDDEFCGMDAHATTRQACKMA